MNAQKRTNLWLTLWVLLGVWTLPELGRAAALIAPGGTNEIRLNFRAAPLETILSQFSEAAGFIIDLRTSVTGKATVWSQQPVSQEEALQLLDAALAQNGYTAVRNGRTLTIWTQEEARKRNLPVKSGNKPEAIPRNEEMVTQIIPLRHINAVQLSRDLQSFKPDSATWTANEGGNALVVTDQQANIHRLAEIIQALDTSVASVSTIHVFPIKYADAKSLSSVIKDLFATQTSSRSAGGSATGAAGVAVEQFLSDGAGYVDAPAGPGSGASPGAGPRASTRSGGASSTGGQAPVPAVVAVAEERSNSLVVSAPTDRMPLIMGIVQQLDVNVQDVTELRVFHLKNADPQETADLMTQLFSDTGNSSSSFSAMIQFGSGGPGFGQSATRGTDQASRKQQQQNKVVAVADPRSSSVVISAARTLMPQLEGMIADLDSDPAKKQQVFVFNTQNTDPQAIQDILQSLFPAPSNASGMNSRANSRQQNGTGNQLNSRATQNQNQRSSATMGRSGMGMGSSSLGSAFGGSVQ